MRFVEVLKEGIEEKVLGDSLVRGAIKTIQDA